MIGKVTRGSDVGGLLRYLFGPGRANEHTDPHVVAAWDDPLAHELAQPAGRTDIRRLAQLLEQPLTAAAKTPAKPVWQCSLRSAPGDRPLTDAEWADVAREALTRTGLAPNGDEGACRWVAVRHAVDHIHLAVTLARQDGRSPRLSNDFHRVGEACRVVEQRYELTITAPRDRTAPRRPTRGEREKASRHRRSETPRETLRREVRVAAAGASDTAMFLHRLRAQGVMVKERYSEQEPGRVTGYAVAWPGDRSGQGQAIWFGGSKLGSDLSLPRLARRWATADDESPGQSCPADASDRSWTPPAFGLPRSAPWQDAAQTARAAAATLTGGSTLQPSASAEVVRATTSLLFATARALEGSRGGRVTRAADLYERAAGGASSGTAPQIPMVRALLASARHLSAAGSRQPPSVEDAQALLRSLAGLMQAAAALSQARGQLAEASAARRAAEALTAPLEGLPPGSTDERAARRSHLVATGGQVSENASRRQR